ncbi:O-methylsterigmatocystin oxidoreductase, partial [Leucoagaricus sp. SymC.cos]
YSSRPTFWVAGYLAGRSNNVFYIKSTSPRFKTYRALLHKTLNQIYRPSASPDGKSANNCQQHYLLETPDDFIAHVRRNAVALVMRVPYGYQVKSTDDKFVNILEETFALSGSINTPSKYWVEFLPLCAFGFTADGEYIAHVLLMTGKLRRLDIVPFNWAISQVSTGSYEESFISDHIYDKGFAPTEEEREDILRWCAAALYFWGGDTTVSVMTTFFLLMKRHPDVQQRAREEIDSVLGGNWATHDDLSSLPYVNAMIKEIMRWGPVVPLGIPHQTTEDDGFNGYFIPKDTRVVANIWGMAYDENVYPNPTKFDPTRFLGEHPQMDPLKYAFGFGRRICPGLHLAGASIFLNLANILANFTISKKCGPDGQGIEPEANWMPGLTVHLQLFLCKVTPRSPEALRAMLAGSKHA